MSDAWIDRLLADMALDVTPAWCAHPHGGHRRRHALTERDLSQPDDLATPELDEQARLFAATHGALQPDLGDPPLPQRKRTKPEPDDEGDDATHD